MDIISPPPPPSAAPPKKKGLGCWGIGCIVLALVALLFVVIIGSIIGVVYSKVMSITSPTPISVETFDGGDDLYQAAQQKLSDFNQSEKDNKPATLELTQDEINTLIARNPDLAREKIHLFVTLQDDTAKMQVSVPTDLVPGGLLKGRFLNCDVAFGIDFDGDDKSFHLKLKSLNFGNQEMSSDQLPLIEAQIDQRLNLMLQTNPDFKDAFAQVKSVEIKESKLVIETK